MRRQGKAGSKAQPTVPTYMPPATISRQKVQRAPSRW
jgi:hypothetical protein